MFIKKKKCVNYLIDDELFILKKENFEFLKYIYDKNNDDIQNIKFYIK